MKRVVNLAAQWEKHRAPLIQEHRRLKEMCSHQEVSLRTQVFSVSMETVPSDSVICGFVAGIFQEAVRNQEFA